MKKTIVVFGITGQQGGSVADYILRSPDLAAEYHVRGVTRDPSNAAAQAFQERGVELRAADWSDTSSLASAVQGANTVFLVTLPAGPDTHGGLRETTHGNLVVEAAVDAGVEKIVFSTLPDTARISGGRFTGIHSYNAKAAIEAYIRDKPVRSAFVASSRFMQNYVGAMMPRRAGADGPYIVRDLFAPDERAPLIDIVADTGKVVGAILRDFDAYEGKTLVLAENLYSFNDVAAALGRSSAQQVVYEQVSEEAMRKVMPPAAADSHIESVKFQQESDGMFGAQTADLIQQTRKATGGALTSFDEFLEANKWFKE